MPFQPAPACAEAVFKYSRKTSGAPMGTNVLNFQKDDMTAFSVTDLDNLADELVTWHGTDVTVLQSTESILDEIILRGLASESDVTVSRSIGNDGTQTGDPAPANVTFVVSFRTGLTGRSFRGRYYHVGMTETQIEGDTVTSAFRSAVTAIWATLATAVASLDMKHVVLSRWSNGVLRENALPTPITSYITTDAIVDTMRRRLP